MFKYTLTGTLLGSWTIDAANASPTGITINPTNVSDIWIVDNGTDKVYQYTAAASRTSGSQNAAATFALAAGNTNPQGIADPPPPDDAPGRGPATPTGARYRRSPGTGPDPTSWNCTGAPTVGARGSRAAWTGTATTPPRSPPRGLPTRPWRRPLRCNP